MAARLYEADIAWWIYEANAALGMSGTWEVIANSIARGRNGGGTIASTDPFHERMINRLNGDTVARAHRCKEIWEKLDDTQRGDLWAYYSLQSGTEGTRPSQQEGISVECRKLREKTEREQDDRETGQRQKYRTEDDPNYNQLRKLCRVFGAMTGMVLRLAKETDDTVIRQVLSDVRKDRAKSVLEVTRVARERVVVAHGAWRKLAHAQRRGTAKDEPDALDRALWWFRSTAEQAA